MDKKSNLATIAQIIHPHPPQAIIEIHCGFFLAIPKNKMKGCFIIHQDVCNSFPDLIIGKDYKIVRYSDTGQLVEGVVRYIKPSTKQRGNHVKRKAQ